MPDAVARTAGVRLGHEYPPPIVDHATARRIALELYGRIKKQ
jgi:deoxyribodipyrimidine photo-lyase